MIKEAMMKQAQKQLGELAEVGFKNLQDKLDRVNVQNDMIVDSLNEMMRAQLALWGVLKKLHPGKDDVFCGVEKELNIKMESE
jgi:hypothetical protein